MRSFEESGGEDLLRLHERRFHGLQGFWVKKCAGAKTLPKEEYLQNKCLSRDLGCCIFFFLDLFYISIIQICNLLLFTY